MAYILQDPRPLDAKQSELVQARRFCDMLLD